jgi:mRNA interferase MazF
LHQQVRDFDDLLLPDHEDFPDTGLKAPSLIRLGFLAVLPSNRLLGTIGALSSERHLRLLQRLSTYLRREPSQPAAV